MAMQPMQRRYRNSIYCWTNPAAHGKSLAKQLKALAPTKETSASALHSFIKELESNLCPSL